jgi:3-dehydroquinate dehydratase / shikimate dehydrogenase
MLKHDKAARHSTAEQGVSYHDPISMRKRLTLPRICVVATGQTSGELLESARSALLDSRFVELRLDWTRHPEETISMIPKLLAQAGRARGPILQATCRRRRNGGRFAGSVARQLDMLEKAAQAGCVICDLEVESAESAGPAAVAALRRIALVILSFHDFHRTPSLKAAARRLREFPADYYKIVPTAARQSDNCAVLEFLASAKQSRGEAGKWLAFAMGEVGVPSRVLALSRGSAFIYTAPSNGSGSGERAAAGQLDRDTLRTRFRAESLTMRTALYGLLGYPVGHSVGAAIHNAAFAARRLDAAYLPLLSNDVGDFRKAAERYPLSGFSVTIPHKQAILRYVGASDRWVRATGAANTVRVRHGRWEAINTDVEGIREPLGKAYRLSGREKLPRDFRAVIVGNGGSARAAFIALRSLGCRRICVAGRNPARLRRFAAAFGGTALSLDSLRREPFDLLIHATPVGMWPHHNEALLSADQLQASVVFDLVYNPPETRLLQLARSLGRQTISGLEMFLAQAGRQFHFWTGEEPPANQMRRVALRELAKLLASAEDRGRNPG